MGSFLDADDFIGTALSHYGFHSFLGLLETKGLEVAGRGLGTFMTKDSLGHRHGLPLTVKETRREVTERYRVKLFMDMIDQTRIENCMRFDRRL